MIRFFYFLLMIAGLINSVVGQVQDNSFYLKILKRAEKYDSTDIPGFPKFTYQSPNDSCLIALRKKFKLDSIAGFGNETTRVLNLLHWVHNTVSHDGQHESGITKINANEILTAAIERNTKVCCGELASTLNDCYLAMGWKSRKIYCFPKDSLRVDHDSHVINIVYLYSKQKWILVDPTNDAYIKDENGELLSIEEVRERLIQGKTLIINPDANYNHISSVTKDYYLDYYMTKNLYRFYCPLNSEYDYETWGQNHKVVYVYLWPLDYQKKLPFKTDDYYNEDVKTTFNTYNIFNSKLFWQKPSD